MVENDIDSVDPDDLIAEKRLWDVLKQSSRLKISRFNIWVTGISALIFSLDAVFGRKHIEINADFVREFSKIGIATGFSVIAFLVSGFAVFVSMTDKSLFSEKAITKDEDSGLSFLKRDMFAIMAFYGHLIAYICACVLIAFLSRKGGFGHSLAQVVGGDLIREILVGMAYVFIGTFTVFIILQLKSFIFNTYHLLMSSIYWQFKKPHD